MKLKHNQLTCESGRVHVGADVDGHDDVHDRGDDGHGPNHGDDGDGGGVPVSKTSCLIAIYSSLVKPLMCLLTGLKVRPV